MQTVRATFRGGKIISPGDIRPLQTRHYGLISMLYFIFFIYGNPHG